MAEWSKDVFAKNLRKYMEASGKNQKEMAEIVGVSAPTFNEWLKGKKFPRIDKIETMAIYFGILKSDLIEEKSLTTTDEADFHAKILKDTELLETIKEYYSLEPKSQAIVRKFVHSLIDIE